MSGDEGPRPHDEPRDQEASPTWGHRLREAARWGWVVAPLAVFLPAYVPVAVVSLLPFGDVRVESWPWRVVAFLLLPMLLLAVSILTDLLLPALLMAFRVPRPRRVVRLLDPTVGFLLALMIMRLWFTGLLAATVTASAIVLLSIFLEPLVDRIPEPQGSKDRDDPDA